MHRAWCSPESTSYGTWETRFLHWKKSPGTPPTIIIRDALVAVPIAVLHIDIGPDICWVRYSICADSTTRLFCFCFPPSVLSSSPIPPLSDSLPRSIYLINFFISRFSLGWFSAPEGAADATHVSTAESLTSACSPPPAPVFFFRVPKRASIWLAEDPAGRLPPSFILLRVCVFFNAFALNQGIR